MKAEVISVGDELTSGQRLDTNSQWLSQQLLAIGIPVVRHTTVGDDLHDSVCVFREAFGRADVVLCTGGLGPTADDLTRQAIAEATGSELVRDEQVLEHIRRLFARRGRVMPVVNEIQAHFPRGSRVIANPHGTAPGIDITVPRPGRQPARLFALPGVPAEMRQMWQQTVRPQLQQLLGGQGRVICHRRIKCFGIGESELEQRLPELTRRGQQPLVGITVSRATITLRVTAEGHSHDECLQVMQPTIEQIYQSLGELVFGEEDDELEDAVVRLLKQHSRTLAVAECGTGGLIAHWLSRADVDRRWFPGGLVLASPRALMARLDQGDAAGVSAEQVGRLAEQCRSELGADLGLAVGPFPTDCAERDPPAPVHLALAAGDALTTRSVPFAAHPDIRTALIAKRALNLVRLTLQAAGQRPK